MSFIKTALASSTYIVNTGSTVTPFVFSNPAQVLSGTNSSASALITSVKITNPGIFTAGTAPEGTPSNPTNDSNS